MKLRNPFHRNSGTEPGDSSSDAGLPAEARRLVGDYLASVRASGYWWNLAPRDEPAGRAILEADRALQVEAARAVLEQLALSYSQPARRRAHEPYLLYPLLAALLARRLAFSEDDILRLLDFAIEHSEMNGYWRTLVKLVERQIEETGLSSALRDRLSRWARLPRYATAEDRKRVDRVGQLLGLVQAASLEKGEPWADTARADLAAMDAPERAAWTALLEHSEMASSTRPTGAWLKRARERIAAVGESAYTERVLRWFPETAKNPGALFQYHNADILKGLVWACRLVEDPRLPAAVADVAEAAYHKIPGEGPRSAKVGNGCVITLGAMTGMEAVTQLERLRRKVKYRVALTLIEDAFRAAAQRSGLSPAEMEEMAVPTYGMEEPGRLREEVGDYVAELVLGPGKPAWSWSKDGRPLKSVPAAVKEKEPDAWKAMKATADDLAKMLPAQRARVERLLLSEQRWPLEAWRARYLDHPLIAHFARRLIWHFQDPDGRAALGIWRDGALVDVSDAALDWLAPETEVALWHPIGAAPETVLRWRIWLEEHRVAQPFKQAHREVYILTDAELQTLTYSNRFASHILRQHQFSALCRERGWRYQLQGAWDSPDEMATLALPAWGLRAEFWTDRPWDAADLERDLSDMGVFLHVVTDQVRFTDPHGTPLPLTEIPALVFSEVMRDVDLFVGVSSVGNDPGWQDRGEAPPNQYAYWRSYSFGDLGASAQTRRDVLTRLLPRLKIAGRCTLDAGGKFLVVRGDLRTYKIHLGSGNILMEPNDQYLCIVPDRGKDRAGDVFLPFEGDAMLSVILSKAFLLAEDRKITDLTITRQIGR